MAKNSFGRTKYCLDTEIEGIFVKNSCSRKKPDYFSCFFLCLNMNKSCSFCSSATHRAHSALLPPQKPWVGESFLYAAFPRGIVLSKNNEKMQFFNPFPTNAIFSSSILSPQVATCTHCVVLCPNSQQARHSCWPGDGTIIQYHTIVSRLQIYTKLSLKSLT